MAAALSSSSPQRQPKETKFVNAIRKVYRPLGFSKGYNFSLLLVIIFAGAMLGFVFARFPYLNVAGNAQSSFKNNAAPGEWYNYRKGHMRVGITLHLAGCIPAGFLAIWQFVPVIRHKALLFHRINGYVVMLLVLVCNAGALMIARHSFGGGLDIQSAVGTLALLTTSSMAMAYYNIKRLQIDQHRAWMLRTWFYLGTIITTRLIMICCAKTITSIGSYYMIKSCGQIAYTYTKDGGRYSVEDPSSKVTERYPACATGIAETRVLVQADMKGGPENIAAALGLAFGVGLWMSIMIHALGIEIYLWLTPAEAERLRIRSYERQLESGMKNPGSSGLTSDRWGDAPDWQLARSSASPVIGGK